MQVLSTLALANGQCEKQLVDQGALTLLIPLLREAYGDALYCALCTLSHLAFVGPNCRRIVDAGALPLLSAINGKPFGRPNAGVDMTFDFPTLVSHAVKTRPLKGGAIVGSGTVSNRDADGGPGKPVSDGGVGYSCLAEVRTVETILGGKAETPFLKKGDTVRIWMEDDKHHPIFGVIEQTVG